MKTLPLVALVPLLACGKPVAPAAAPTVSLAVEEQSSPSSSPTVSASVGARTMFVQGDFHMPCVATNLLQTVIERDGSSYTLNVRYRDDVPCAAAVTPVRYRADIMNVPAGTYTLAVFHERDAYQLSSGSRVLLDTLSVPASEEPTIRR